MCCVVLGLGTVLKLTTGVNGVACLVMFFFFLFYKELLSNNHLCIAAILHTY